MQSALPQRDGEVNLTLGGIDLNNSGRYVQTIYCLEVISKEYGLWLLLYLQCRCQGG